MPEDKRNNNPDVPQLTATQRIDGLMDAFQMERLKDHSNIGVDPYRANQAQGVNLAGTNNGGLNFERYYNKDAYSKLGFNPFRDNEAYYNKNSTAWDDFKDARSQWWNLAGLGFRTLWSGKTDREEAREYERYSNIGTTTREGGVADLQNAFLNSGYTIGLLAEIAAEEIAMSAASIATGGALTGGAAARTVVNAERARRAFNMGQKMTSMINRLRDLKDITKAKNAWEMTRKVGQAVNPLRGTTEYLSAQRALDAADGISDLAQASKTAGAFYRDVREIRLAFDEAHLESGFVSNTIKDDLINQYIQETGEHPGEAEMAKINKEAELARKNTLATNSMLIYGTNRVAFGNLFNKWMPRAFRNAGLKTVNGRLVKNFKTGKLDFIKHGGLAGYKTLINEAKYAAANVRKLPLQTAKFAGKYTRTNVGEGIQEYFQEVIQDAEQTMAKDRYAGMVAGGAWYNALNNDAYMDQYARSMSKYISEEGWDVFKGGFLMGIFAGGFGRASSSLTRTLDKHGKWVYDRDGYRKDKAEAPKREAEFEEQLEKFNNMTDARKDFLYEYINFLQRRVQNKAKMDQATETNDKHAFYNAKDRELAENILFAQRMGGEELIINTLKDLANMPEEDLKDAFGENIENDTDFTGTFKETADELIEKAEQIMGFSKDFDKLFPPPTYQAYEDSDFGDIRTQRSYLQYSREQAKILAITNQYELVRTMDRMASILKNTYEQPPFWDKQKSPPASELTKIFNGFEMKQEVDLLNDEIRALKGFSPMSPAQRRDLDYKTKQRDLLKKFISERGPLTNYRKALQTKAFLDVKKQQIEDAADLQVGKVLRYRRGDKAWEGQIVGETEDSKGRPQWIIDRGNGKTSKVLKSSEGIITEKFDEELYEDAMAKPTKELENLYKDYLDLVGKHYDNTINEAKFNESFENFRDFYTLEEDKKNLSETVSLLMDPGAHYELVKRFEEVNKAKRRDMRSEVEAQLEQYQDAVDISKLINMLAREYNVMIAEDELHALVEDKIVPEDYYNIDTNEPLRHGTERYENIVKAVENFLGLEEVEKEEEVIEEKVSEEKPITPDTPFDEWINRGNLREKAQAMMDSYNESIEGTDAKEFDDLEDFVSENRPGYFGMRKAIEEYNKTLEPIEEEQETPVEEITEEVTGEVSDTKETLEGIERPETQRPEVEPKVEVEVQKADIERRRQEELEKPYKTLNDGSGKMVTISTETTEKEGVKKTKFKTETTNRKGEARTQDDKGYNTFEEAVENLGIDLQSEENETALELVETLKESEGKETLPARVQEIRELTDKSSPFFGMRTATIVVGNEKIEFRLKSDAELAALEAQKKPKGDSKVETKISAIPVDKESARPSQLEQDIEDQVFTGSIKYMSLGTSKANDLVKPFGDGKVLPRNTIMADMKPGQTITISKKTADNRTTYANLTYRGHLAFNELDIDDPVQELDVRAETPVLEAGKEGEVKYKQPVVINGETFYAPSFDMLGWIGGSAKLHVFEVSEPIIKRTKAVKETKGAWQESVEARLNTAVNPEQILADIQKENLERKSEGLPSLTAEELNNIYAGVIKDFKESLTLDNINLQDHFKVNIPMDVKGKSLNFGTAKVIEITDLGVTFESTGTKTQGMTKFIKEDALKDVIKSKIEKSTDIQEDVADKLTSEEEKIVDKNSKSAEKFAKDSASVKRVIAKTKTQSTEETDDNFFNELGCD